MANWVFAQTTYVDRSKYRSAWWTLIMYFKFHQNRSRVLRDMVGRNLPLTIDLANGLYNSLHYCASRDKPTENANCGWGSLMLYSHFLAKWFTHHCQSIYTETESADNIKTHNVKQRIIVASGCNWMKYGYRITSAGFHPTRWRAKLLVHLAAISAFKVAEFGTNEKPVVEFL